ncbi:hypothetical protein BGZ90_002786, partial [Linnemannia elongata]
LESRTAFIELITEVVIDGPVRKIDRRQEDAIPRGEECGAADKETMRILAQACKSQPEAHEM